MKLIFFNFLLICITVDVFEANLKMEWMILLNQSVKTSKLITEEMLSEINNFNHKAV